MKKGPQVIFSFFTRQLSYCKKHHIFVASFKFHISLALNTHFGHASVKFCRTIYNISGVKFDVSYRFRIQDPIIIICWLAYKILFCITKRTCSSLRLTINLFKWNQRCFSYLPSASFEYSSFFSYTYLLKRRTHKDTMILRRNRYVGSTMTTMTTTTTTTTTTSSPAQHRRNEYLKIFYLFIFFSFTFWHWGDVPKRAKAKDKF